MYTQNQEYELRLQLYTVLVNCLKALACDQAHRLVFGQYMKGTS